MSSNDLKGWVYVISNRAMPDIIKIGYTNRTPEVRAAELDGTSSPFPHVIEYAVRVLDPASLEKNVHVQLKSNNVGKEWFECDLLLAVRTIRSEAIDTITFEQLGERLINTVEPLDQKILSSNKDSVDLELQKRAVFQQKMKGYRERSEKYSLHCKELQKVAQAEIEELQNIFIRTHGVFWPKIMSVNKRKDSRSSFDAGIIYKEWEAKNRILIEDYLYSESEKHKRSNTKFRSTRKYLGRNTLIGYQFRGSLSGFVNSIKEATVGIDDDAEFL